MGGWGKKYHDRVDVPHPVPETSRFSRGLVEVDASVRCGRSVADPSDDRADVQAVGEVAERIVELFHGPESVRPEQMLHEGTVQSLEAAIASGLANA